MTDAKANPKLVQELAKYAKENGSKGEYRGADKSFSVSIGEPLSDGFLVVYNIFPDKTASLQVLYDTDVDNRKGLGLEFYDNKLTGQFSEFKYSDKEPRVAIESGSGTTRNGKITVVNDVSSRGEVAKDAVQGLFLDVASDIYTALTGKQSPEATSQTQWVKSISKGS